MTNDLGPLLADIDKLAQSTGNVQAHNCGVLFGLRFAEACLKDEFDSTPEDMNTLALIQKLINSLKEN